MLRLALIVPRSGSFVVRCVKTQRIADGCLGMHLPALVRVVPVFLFRGMGLHVREPFAVSTAKVARPLLENM